jgi:hypothetical protein
MNYVHTCESIQLVIVLIKIVQLVGTVGKSKHSLEENLTSFFAQR